MAISSGFPPSNTISPSVRINELDLSFIAPEQTFHRGGLVGFASKGPINIPTVINTSRQLHTIFGNPHPDVGDPYLIYAGDQYLTIANQLYVVRVADTSPSSDEKATTASIDIPSSGGQIVIQSDTAGTYTFATDSFFRWKLNGVLASKTLVVLSDDNRPAPDTSSAYSTDDLVAALNDQLTASIDGIKFVNNGNKIAVQTVFAYGPNSELELISVSDAIYGPDGVTGLGTGMTPASVTGEKDRYPDDGYQLAGTFNWSGLSNLNLQVVVNGTNNVLIDNVVQTIDFSALEGLSNSIADIVNEINTQITDADVPGGFVASATGNNLTLTTLASGRDSELLVKTSSTTAGIFGFDGITAIGTSPSGISGDMAVATYGIVDGAANNDSEITFTLTADSPGIEGNNTQVVIANNIREDTFVIDVYSNGAQVETWGPLTKDQTNTFYIETYLPQVSSYIIAVDNTNTGASPLDGTYTLTGGSDGIPADPDDQDALLIGNNADFTGMFSLSEPEQIDIDLVAVPGHASTNVVTALINLCQNQRQDCLAIIDPPFGLTVNEIVQWQNGVHPLNDTRFDTDFAALYWPWLKYQDVYNNLPVWIPPSGSVMAMYANSDRLSAPWFAPAGLNRGQVPNIVDVYSRPTLEERDLMYGNSNCINPIIQFADTDGFLAWGQKTMQRTPTALDRVNVRRLMFVCEKQIKSACRQLLFDPNDQVFLDKFTNIVKGILTSIQVGRGITDFQIQADSTINTPDVIDRNEFRAIIGIVPTRAVEYIFLEFTINRTGAFDIANAI